MAAVRLSISIQEDLKTRMDAVPDAVSVNWSAVASRAFESKLWEIEAMKEDFSMEQVVERLRASKQESDVTHRSEGKEAGADWARRTASADELSALHKYWEDLSSEHYDPTAEDVLAAIDGERPDKYRFQGFWEDDAIGENYEREIRHAAFVRGFIEGAVGVWSEVADKL